VIRVHGTTVSLNGKAVLIRGVPGSGKSALALQLMESTGHGLSGETIKAHLVADDQSELLVHDGHVVVRAPDTLSGRLELRGFGILRVKPETDVPLVLVIDLRDASIIERLPQHDQTTETFLGLSFPRFEIDPTAPSAAARVRTLFAWVTGTLAAEDHGA
jgi:HPr kinase/phosphorylase